MSGLIWSKVAVCWSSTAGLIVLWSAICALNAMSRSTLNMIRLSYVLLGVGAGAAILAPGYLHRPPSLAELFLITGLAVLAVFDRRRKH